MPSVYEMYNGRTHVRFDRADGFLDNRCFVLMPNGYVGETMPDEYIYPPSDIAMNRDLVNRWWMEYRERALAAASSL